MKSWPFLLLSVPVAALAILLMPAQACAQTITPAPAMLFADVLDPSFNARDHHKRLNRLHNDATIVSYWIVEVSVPFLDDELPLHLNIPTAQSTGKPRSAPALLDDVHVERRALDDFTWVGRANSSESRAVLVIRGKQVYGSIHSGGKSYRLRPLHGTLHTLSLMKPDSTPLLEPLRENPTHRLPTLMLPQAASPDAPFEYTVLIAYTEAARKEAGGSSAIEAVAQLAIDDANDAYRNSNIALRGRLAHIYEETGYVEGTIYDDIRRLEDPADGFLDDIHILRNRYHADIAILFIRFDKYGGIAATISASQAEAFAVVASSKATSTSIFAFAHEIGHLQGAGHNKERNTNHVYSYGHGYCNQTDGWRTIMSYTIWVGPKGSETSLCPRVIPYFSNPSVTYGGNPTGPNANVNDNARVLEETANRVTKFRYSIPTSSSLIESTFGIPHGNFELVAREGSHLRHYYRDNNAIDFSWIRGEQFAKLVRSTPSLIQGTFVRGHRDEFDNFEVVVRERRWLRHYFRDNNRPDAPWQRGARFSNGKVASAPALLQSGFGSPHGNFEVVVREGRSLRHYYRDNNDPLLPWRKGELFGDRVGSGPAFIQSSFGNPHGNFEVVVREGEALRHYYRLNNRKGTPWIKGDKFGKNIEPGVAPRMIESNFGEQHGNFEVIVQEGESLRHYYRDNNDPAVPWLEGELFGADVDKLIGFIQSSIGTAHGGFEVVVQEGDSYRHYYRDNDTPEALWQAGAPFP